MSTLRDRLDAAFAQLKPSQEREAKQPDPPGVTVTADMVRAAHVASWGAYAALVLFMWLKVLSVAQDQYESLDISHVGPWENLDLLLHFPLILPYIIVVAIVPYVAKQVIPMMVSIRWQDNPWGKGLAVFIAVMVSFVLISGTATVGGHAVMEGERDAAVAVEQVQQGRAGLEASITSAEAELKSMMENRNAYLAQAASVGEEQWIASYVAQAKREKDARLPMIERATGAARAADAKRAEIKALRQQLATSTGVAAVASEVKTERLGALSTILGFLDTFWVLLLALVVDITCLFFPFLAYILKNIRNRQLAMVRGETFVMSDGKPAWADESHMIRDHRQDEKLTPAPMDSGYQGDVIYDGHTGDELSWVEGYVNKRGKWVPGHYRKTGKKKPVVQDEKGTVLESDSRAARSGVETGDEHITATAGLVSEDRRSDEHERSGEDEDGHVVHSEDRAPDATILPAEEIAALVADGKLIDNQDGTFTEIPDERPVDDGESLDYLATGSDEIALPSQEGIMVREKAA